MEFSTWVISALHVYREKDISLGFHPNFTVFWYNNLKIIYFIHIVDWCFLPMVNVSSPIVIFVVIGWLVRMIRGAHGVQGVWARVKHAGALGFHLVEFLHPASVIWNSNIFVKGYFHIINGIISFLGILTPICSSKHPLPSYSFIDCFTVKKLGEKIIVYWCI